MGTELSTVDAIAWVIVGLGWIGALASLRYLWKLYRAGEIRITREETDDGTEEGQTRTS